MTLLIEIIIALVQALLLLALAPLVSGFTRWMRAKIHTRKGPPIRQDYYDIIKLFKRQDVHTKDSSFVHRLMPTLFLGVIIVLTMGMPIITRFSPLPPLADIILVIYLLALPRFFFSLSAVDSGSSYAGVGGVRELIVGILCEPTIILALFVVVLATGTSNVGEMGVAVGALAITRPVALIAAAVAFAGACYIELGKLPFDLAEAEQEVQEGPLTEYSGPSLAMLKLALSLKQMLVVSWFLAIFVPFGSAAALTPLALVIGLVVFLVKLELVFFICALIENVVARVRFKLLGKQTWMVFGLAAFAFVFCILGI